MGAPWLAKCHDTCENASSRGEGRLTSANSQTDLNLHLVHMSKGTFPSLLIIYVCKDILTLKAPSKICSRRHSNSFFFFFFQRKQILTFHVNRLLGIVMSSRRFT